MDRHAHTLPPPLPLEGRAMARIVSALPRRLITGLNARKSGYRTGRQPEQWPPVPRVSAKVVEAVADWAQTHRENRRPLSVAAPVLAIVCALHEKRHPFPTRARLAEAIGCTKFGVDAAISTAIGHGEVTERWEALEGAVVQRKSARRVRYVDPHPELLRIYRDAVKKGQQPLEALRNALIGVGQNPETAGPLAQAIVDAINVRKASKTTPQS